MMVRDVLFDKTGACVGLRTVMGTDHAVLRDAYGRVLPRKMLTAIQHERLAEQMRAGEQIVMSVAATGADAETGDVPDGQVVGLPPDTVPND